MSKIMNMWLPGRTRKNSHTSKKGFTLVELIVVLVILAILAAVAIPAFLGYIDSSKEKQYIADAEAALASTRAAFTEIYNDGSNRLTPSRRSVAREEAGFEKGMTAFTVWTSAQLLDGETEANSDHIASYTISFAKFVAQDGRVVVLRNNVWTVYENETEAKKAQEGETAALKNTQGVDDGDVTGSVHGNIVYVWKKGTPEVVAEGDDTAFDPPRRGASKKKEDWNVDGSLFEYNVKVNIYGHILLDNGAKTQLLKFVPEAGEKQNAIAVTFDGQNYNVDPNQYDKDTTLGQQAGYDTDQSLLRWVYNTQNSSVQFKDFGELKEYLASHYEELEGEEISLTTYMPHDYSPLAITFAAYNPNTQSVGLDADVLRVGSNVENKKDIPSISGNTLTLKKDRVTGTFSEQSEAALEKLNESAILVSQNPALNAKGTDIATYSHDWLVMDGGVYKTFRLSEATTDTSDQDDESQGGDEQQTQPKEDDLIAYIKAVDVSTTSSIRAETPAYINRTVFMHATDSQGNEVGAFEGKADSVYDLTFKQNELPGSEILDEKGNKVDSKYDFVEQAQMTYGTTTNLAGAVRKNKPKKWNAFDCKKDGTDPSNERSISRAGYEDEIREEITDHLFAEDSDLYGLMVEVEVGYLTAQLDYDEYLTDEAHRNNPAKLCLYFRQLAGVTNKEGALNKIDNLRIPVDKVMYINKDERANYGYYSEGFTKEFCISTTKMQENPNSVDGKHVLDWGYGTDNLGDFKVDENNLVEEYPDYIVAYSVKTGNTYSIYVFTEEDDSDLKAEESMQALFFGYRIMTENSFIQHMETSGVERFKGMFGRCEAMTGQLDIRTFDITKSADSSQMFYYCGITGIQVSSGFNTQFNNYFDKMFAYCPNLASVPEINIRSAYDIYQMFMGCTVLDSVILTGADTAGTDEGDSDFLGKPEDLAKRPYNTSIVEVFKGCEGLGSITLENLYTTYISDLTNLYSADSIKGSVTKIIIKNVNMPNLKTTASLFKGYSELTYVALDNFTPAPPDANGVAVVNATSMFEGCSSLVGGTDTTSDNYFNLGGFELSIVKATQMFKNCTSLIIADLGLDTSRIKDMSNMFNGCTAINQKPVSVHINIATTIQSMFAGCEHLEEVHLIGAGKDSSTKCPISTGNTENVFNGCTDLRAVSISDVTFSNLEGLGSFFASAEESLEEVAFSNVGIPKVKSFKELFKGYSSLTTVEFSNTDTSTVTDMSFMFCDCSGLTNANLKGLNTSSATDMESMFQNCVGIVIQDLGLNTLKAKNMKNMFNGCSAVQKETTLHIDVAEDVTAMFAGCSNLAKVNLIGAGKTKTPASLLDGSKTSEVFNGCTSMTDLTIDSVNFSNLVGFGNFTNPIISTLKNVTLSNLSIPNITSFQLLFQGGDSLESVSFAGTDTSAVTNMASMFEGCKKLTDAKLVNLKTTSAQNMASMFKGCENVTIAGLGLETSNAIDMSYMFYGCKASANKSTGNFHIDCANNLQSMFENCSNLTDVHLIGAGKTGNVKCTVVDDVAIDVFKSAKVKNLTLEKVIFSGFTVSGDKNSGLKNMVNTAKGTLETFALKDVALPNLQTMSNLFYQFNKLGSVEIRNVDAPKLTRFKNFMREATSLTDVTIRGFELPDDEVNFALVFFKCSSLQNVDFGEYGDDDAFSAEGITQLNSTFAGCTSLTTLNLSALNCRKVNAAKTMFGGCTQLTTIYAADPVDDGYGLDLSTVTNDMDPGDKPLESLIGMFDGCESLTGPVTPYDPAYKGKEYARVEKEGQAGYFTHKGLRVVALEPLSDNWITEKTPVTDKTKITGFERVTGITEEEAIARAGGAENNMAAEGQEDSVYMWLDGTTLKWWSGAKLLKISGNTTKMFNGWSSLASVDLSGLDLSEVTDMSYFFNGCSKLKNVNFGNADISSVTNFSYMFNKCSSLQSVTMNIDTSGVSSNVNMSYMFSESSVKSVSITGDWSNVTDISFMFNSAKQLNSLSFGEQVDMSRLYTMRRIITGTNTTVLNAFKTCFAQWDMGNNVLFEDPDLWNTRAKHERNKVTQDLGFGGTTLTDVNGKNYIIEDNKYLHISN